MSTKLKFIIIIVTKKDTIADKMPARFSVTLKLLRVI